MLLKIENLKKTAGNAVLLPEVNLCVPDGNLVAMQCNHEQGRLFMKLVIGNLSPSQGEIFFREKPFSIKEQIISGEIGVYFLEDGLYERLSVKEQLVFWKKLFRSDVSIEETIQRIGLIDRANTRIHKLPYSEKRRVHMGRAIINNPNLLLFEDPEHGLDIESCIILRRILSQMQKEGKTVFATYSSLEAALSLTERVYRLTDTGLKSVSIEVDPLEETAASTEGDGVSVPVKLEKIPAKMDDKIILFDPTEIQFIESIEGVPHLHVHGESFPSTSTLILLEEKLKVYGFFRCHRSYIVNLQKVREVITWTRNSYSLILDDGKKSSIPLSKGKIDELKSLLGI